MKKKIVLVAVPFLIMSCASSDKNCYVGTTSRPLDVRIKEHKNGEYPTLDEKSVKILREGVMAEGPCKAEKEEAYKHGCHQRCGGEIGGIIYKFDY